MEYTFEGKQKSKQGNRACWGLKGCTSPKDCGGWQSCGPVSSGERFRKLGWPGVLPWLSAALILVCEFWGRGHGALPAPPSTQTWPWTGQISSLWLRFYISELPTTCTPNFLMCLVFFFTGELTWKDLFVHELFKPSVSESPFGRHLAYPFIAWNRSPLLILLCLQAVKLLR